ncbi:hypothetical protein F2Q70_00011576 [Brassica cretica]|uniref:Uncharacterized protein n=1 Tax=Brassica cretica TaxID=69181 RepID=A0A8S9M930_BRACR|nr:hypothetical protein F2Q70_00011576 [Brassica cretica]
MAAHMHTEEYDEDYEEERAIEKQVYLVEDAEAVDAEGRAEEADVNFISETVFQVVKEEKLQEGDFEVESLMSFGGSHWCRSTPSHEHRSTEETAIDRQPPAPIDRRASLTYRVQMPKIDVARLNALMPKLKHSENPLEAVRTP